MCRNNVCKCAARRSFFVFPPLFNQQIMSIFMFNSKQPRVYYAVKNGQQDLTKEGCVNETDSALGPRRPSARPVEK